MGHLVSIDLTSRDPLATATMWEHHGFTVRGGVVLLGGVALRLTAGDGPRLAAWVFTAEPAGPAGPAEPAGAFGAPPEVLPPTGLVTAADTRAPTPPPHANGVTGLDHVVVMTPGLDATVAALEAAGLGLRRRASPRGTPMAFLRAGPVVVEVVAAPGSPAAMLWGLSLRVDDVDAAVVAVGKAGGQASDPRPAVQGGRIATVRDGGCGVPVAFQEPGPRP